MPLVVVLPCEPATAIPSPAATISASRSARWWMTSPSRPASTSSGSSAWHRAGVADLHAGLQVARIVAARVAIAARHVHPALREHGGDPAHAAAADAEQVEAARHAASRSPASRMSSSATAAAASGRASPRMAADIAGELARLAAQRVDLAPEPGGIELAGRARRRLRPRARSGRRSGPGGRPSHRGTARGSPAPRTPRARTPSRLRGRCTGRQRRARARSARWSRRAGSDPRVR